MQKTSVLFICFYELHEIYYCSMWILADHRPSIHIPLSTWRVSMYLPNYYGTQLVANSTVLIYFQNLLSGHLRSNI